MSLDIHNLSVIRSTTFTLTLPTLTVPPGTLLSITGPNGGGKTTLIECMTGLLAPTTGGISLYGQPIPAGLHTIRAAIGLVPDDDAWLIAELCAEEYVGLLRRIYCKAGARTPMAARAVALAERLHFTAWRQPLGKLSHGNKKKVQLIAALMHQPQLLVIDELRNGLDPLAILAAEQLVRDELQRGAVVVAATHDLWWAERMATTVLLLLQGQAAAYGTTVQLVASHGSLEQLFIELATNGVTP
ncbi:MAG TPA: ABC transporter ATP-binding protein [Candidatus Saccharimonadales bacterium]|nr:ABC transporter ATP-binding protein [Candidatus Saccharimonadales bacterium]